MNTSDTPLLTAYVLDELDVHGRDFVNNEMQRHNEWRFEARELADFTDQLRAALATETMPALAPKQERAIAARLQQTGTRRKAFWVPIVENWLLRTELAFLVLLMLWFVPVPASFSIPVQKFFVDASAQTARVLLQAVHTDSEWRGSTLILPAPAPLFPPPPPGVKVRPGFRVRPVTMAIDFNNAACNPRFWITLLLVTGFLLGNLYLRSPWRKLTMIALSIPMVILSDGLRKFVMAEFLLHDAPGASESALFYLAQPLFVIFSLLALLPFLVWFRRSEKAY